MPDYFINPIFANVGPNAGLIYHITMDQTGVPTDGQSGFAPLATVDNVVDGTSFVNQGSSSSSAWVAIPVGTSGSFVTTQKVTIASADILTLNGTPVELVPAPAAGKVIEVLGVVGRMNFLTAAYATNTNLQIVDTTSGEVLAEDSGTLLAAAGNVVASVPLSLNASAGIEITPAGSVSATVETGNPATGAGSLDLYVSYKVITL